MPIRQLSRDFVKEIGRRYPQLERLDLSNNEITKIENLDLLGSMIELDLSNNGISVVENINNMHQLQILCLKNNQITDVAMINSSNLQSIDLSDNLLSSTAMLSPFKSLKCLRNLTLSGNPLTARESYRHDIVTLLPQLKELDGTAVSIDDFQQVSSLQSNLSPPRAKSATSPSESRTSSPLAISPTRSVPAQEGWTDSEIGSNAAIRHDSPDFSISSKSVRLIQQEVNHSQDSKTEASIQSYLWGPHQDRETAEKIQEQRYEEESAQQKRIDELSKALETEKNKLEGLQKYYSTKVANLDLDLSSPSQNQMANLEKQLELRDILIESLRKVIAMQEARISGSDSVDKETKRLHSAWRQKVLSLLIESKTQKLEAKAELHQEKKQFAELQFQIAEQRKENELLKVQLRSQWVESELLQSQKTEAEQSLCSQQKVSQSLQMKNHELLKASKTVRIAVDRLYSESFRFDAFARSVGQTVKGFARRLVFAQSRLRICQDIFAARPNSFSSPESPSAVADPFVFSAAAPASSSSDPLTEVLQSEIDRLSIERSNLLKQISSLAHQKNAEVQKATETLNAQLKEERKLREKSEYEFKQLSSYQTKQEAEIESMGKKIQELETDLDREARTAVSGEERARVRFERHLAEAETKYQNRIITLEEECELRRSNLQSVKQENREFASTIRHLERLIAQNDKGRKELATELEEEYESKMKEKDKRIEKLVEEKNEMKNQLCIVEDRLRIEEKETKSSRDRVRVLTDQIKQLELTKVSNDVQLNDVVSSSKDTDLNTRLSRLEDLSADLLNDDDE